MNKCSKSLIIFTPLSSVHPCLVKNLCIVPMLFSVVTMKHVDVVSSIFPVKLLIHPPYPIFSVWSSGSFRQDHGLWQTTEPAMGRRLHTEWGWGSEKKKGARTVERIVLTLFCNRFSTITQNKKKFYNGVFFFRWTLLSCIKITMRERAGCWLSTTISRVGQNPIPHSCFIFYMVSWNTLNVHKKNMIAKMYRIF